jgi:DNA polymerase/3'-5' exonuclease PolX
VCEAAIRAADATAEWHIAGGYGRGRATAFDLDVLISPAREGDEVGLSGKLLAALEARPEVEWLAHQHHAAPTPGALAALRTEAHRARKLDAAGQGGEPSGGVVSNIDMHDKLFLLLKLRAAPLRRVDFIVAARSQWAFCVLGWAGSRRFERFLRQWASEARAPALRLNSHCAFNRAGGVTTAIAALSGKAVPLERAQEEYIDAGDWPRSEREVFERVLALPYRPPQDRDA